MALGSVALAIGTACFAAGQSPGSIGAASSDDGEVLAWVDKTPLSRRQVVRQMQSALGGRQIDDALRPQAEAAALRHLVDRQLALDFLQARGAAASKEDVALELSRIERHLADREIDLAAHLESIGLSAEEHRQELLWRLSWSRYLAEQLSDENLKRFFQRRRRDFDGTRMRVAQIFWKANPAHDEAALKPLLEQAASLREAIVAGNIPFEEAAAQHSQAPSAAMGGDIGFIRRHEPMPEPFSAAAFSLEPGQVSEPVVSRLGVHLIRCLEIEPGTRTWEETREALADAAVRHLFQWAADQQRPRATIREREDARAEPPRAAEKPLP